MPIAVIVSAMPRVTKASMTAPRAVGSANARRRATPVKYPVRGRAVERAQRRARAAPARPARPALLAAGALCRAHAAMARARARHGV